MPKYFHDECLTEEARAINHAGYNAIADGIEATRDHFLRCHSHIVESFEDGVSSVAQVVLFLMMDYAEMIDSIATLTRTGTVMGIEPSLRTALETRLIIMYLIQKREEYEKRCVLYQYWHLNQYVKTMRQVQKKREEEKGKDRSDWVATDGLFLPAGEFGLEAQLKQAEAYLSSEPSFEVARKAIADKKADMIAEQLKRRPLEKPQKPKIKNWYSVYDDGPNDLSVLAKQVDDETDSYPFYKLLCETCHGAAAMTRIGGMEGTKFRVHPLRFPQGLGVRGEIVCKMTFALGKRLARFYLGQDQDYDAYHKKNVVSKLQGLKHARNI